MKPTSTISAPRNDTTPSSYTFQIPGAAHRSFVVRRNTLLRIDDIEGGANVGMLLFNPVLTLERYNMPDTLKSQHTFLLSKGHCLHSDMGRLFCTFVTDTYGGHETVCGSSNRDEVTKRWGPTTYMEKRNKRHQNGRDCFLTELAKYGLTERDIHANVNFFSALTIAPDGAMTPRHDSRAGDHVELLFAMDALVVMHTCPHPLNESHTYPLTPVACTMTPLNATTSLGHFQTLTGENARAFQNVSLYLTNALPTA